MNNRGMILIISLWILAIISLLCLSLARQIIVDLKLIKFQKDRMKCLYIAKAAIQKAISILESDSNEDIDILNEPWSTGSNPNGQYGKEYILKDVPFDEGFFTVRYSFAEKGGLGLMYLYGMSDEDRKVNINEASRQLLLVLFDAIEGGDPASLAENIIYWRGDAPQGYKEHYYESSHIPYAARGDHLKSMEELSLIKGFREDMELIKECERVFTVYTKDNLININTVPPQILKAVFISLGAEELNLGLSDRLVTNIVDYRDGSDNEEVTDDDVSVEQNKIKEVLKAGLADIVEKGWVDRQVLPFKTNSNFFKIEVSVKLNKGKINKDVTAIIDRSQKPPKVIYWHEE